MKFAQDLKIRIDKIIWARSRVFYVFWHKFYARHMLPYTILWQMYYKSMIRMIRAEAQIPQVHMDVCSLVPNCFSAFGFESLTQSNFCIFVSRCFGMRCKGRAQVGGGRWRLWGTCELRAEQLLQAMIYFRPIRARGCPSNGPHLQRMPRKTTWKKRAKRRRKNKMEYVDYIQYKAG